MSLLTFPTLLGIYWPGRKMGFSTIIQQSVSGQEVRIANWIQARYQWDFPFEYLPGDPSVATDYQTLMGFIELNNGPFSAFLFHDAYDFITSPNLNSSNWTSATGTSPSEIGIGDGSTTTFQIGRVRGGALHYIYTVDTTPGNPKVYVNGVLQSSGYSISPSGLITFGSAPGSGLTIKVDFQYYFRCRFLEDSIEAEQIAAPYYRLKSLVLYETYQ